ncbi:MAG: pyrroline-5-carboxylate reductase [Chloroflexi bacterium]|nr:pyrroline-5-carboxylate reductase [Chloroflexota bacterium]MDA1227637.1 pyrroline-5-carboxylate reductase [Chloroflexota bacterium]
MKLSFIGGGVMAEAIIGGVIEGGIASPEEVRVGEPVAERRDAMEETYGLKAYASNSDVLEGADLVVLAVKPQILPYLLPELQTALRPEHTVASIVAGATMKTLTEGLMHKAVIRIMPNTPAQIGSGMSVWTASDSVTEAAKKATSQILRTLGEEVYVPDEKLIDMATAVSASGPAYVFLFIESMIDAAVYLGMARDMARQLVLQTVLGSTELVKQTGRHPADLKDMVTSPGGTTIEALRSFESRGFRSAVFEGIIAAYEKSKALGS